MISEFQQLTKKVNQLVSLVQMIRGENVELHHQIAALTATNSALAARIQQAHERVSMVLNQLPDSQQEPQ